MEEYTEYMENSMETIEEILQILGSKHPVRKTPIKYEDTYDDWLTISGNKVYRDLIDIIGFVGDICDSCFADSIIEELDAIVNTGGKL
jgi:hypothetical protein